MDEDKKKEAQEELRVKVETVKEFNKKNPQDPIALKWKSEFIEAEKLVVQKQIDDKLARLNKSLYDMDFHSIEEDLQDLERDDYIPMAIYSKKPIVVNPAHYAAMKRSPNPLTEQQKEFCKHMRNRIIVIMSHYANDKDLEERRVSNLTFRCNILPDKPALETWSLPSHIPMSIPLYIIRHFGCMTTNKKIPRVEMHERTHDEIVSDPSMISEGFAFQQVMQVSGTDSYVRFVRLSTVKSQIKKFQEMVS